jgi:spectinomycin phosphotransferase
MREPSRLPDSTIVGVVESNYQLSVSGVVFLPLGADASSVVYRVETAEGKQFLLKGRKPEQFNPASVLVPRQLWLERVPNVLSPLVTHNQSFWASEHGWTWSLFPYVQARMAVETGLTADQWSTLGLTLKRIHTMQLALDTSRLVPTESYRPSRYDSLPRLAEACRKASDDPIKRDFCGLWSSQQDAIAELMRRSEALASELKSDPRPLVLCHADFHVWNILVSRDDGLWIVDWDETILAPKERDLMFVVGSIARNLVSDGQAQSFLQGYGNPNVDDLALAYYRSAWALQDLAAYGEDIFFSPGLGEESRRESLETIRAMFEPGNIVSIALASEP